MKVPQRIEGTPLLNIFGKGPKRVLTPVEAELRQHDIGRSNPRLTFDDIDFFRDKYRKYLSWALEIGLTDHSAVSAAADLAETRAVQNGDYFYADMHREKQEAWNRAVASAADRPPRTIRMELDPIYFKAMLDGRKTIEGRAYDPGSAKNYPDIRQGDRVEYTLSQRLPEFVAQLGELSLQQTSIMSRPVSKVHFAPTVADMYENVGELGKCFQPMLSGLPNVLARIAVYHSFPGYSQRIGDYGFLGIEHPADQIELSP